MLRSSVWSCFISSLIPKLVPRGYRNISDVTQNKFDCTIVGGGIVGLSTARELALRYPKMTFSVLEKETDLSLHQSGNNSGVIHSGIYYSPGSLKAKLCVDGLRRSYSYLTSKNIPHKKCGKLIVALDDQSVERLESLFQRGKQNSVPGIHVISSAEIRDIEPNCVGKCAIYSPETGIVDWRQVALSYAVDFRSAGGTIMTNCKVDDFFENHNPEYPIRISCFDSSRNLTSIESKFVVSCAGLQSDRLAKKSGCSTHPKIIPFRGDFLKLKEEKSNLVRTNIYPVPDPRFPFLGVHFTPRIDGSVWLGPNAILSLDREGYGRWDFNFVDVRDSLSYRGFWKLAKKYTAFGISEFLNGVMISRQVKQLQRYVPSLRASDVVRGPSGIRAQALGCDGNLVEDFVIDFGLDSVGKRIMHVRNAPSPAATSSLAIAIFLAESAKEKFDLGPPVERNYV